MLERATKLSPYRFEQLADQINDRVMPAEAEVERYVGLEHLDSDSLRIRRWGDPSEVDSTKLRFQPGDIIFGKRRVYQRKVAVADTEGICSAHAMVLRAKPEIVLPEFLPFFMQSDEFMERALSISVGSLSPTINWKALAKEEFLLPPIQEQGRVVEACLALENVLEEHLRTLDAIHSLRMALLNDHFVSRVGRGRPLREVADLKSGGTPTRSKEDMWGGGLPWASGKDLKSRDLIQTEETLTETGWEAARIAPQDSTLVVVRGMILAHTFPVAVCRVPMAFNQDLRALIAGPEVMPEYLTLWAEWMGPWFLARTAESSHGTKRLEAHTLEEALVPIEAVDVQEELCEQNRMLLEQTAAAERRRTKLVIIKKELLSEVTRRP
ncbi:MAG: restriction endonuclease subunit S [bacterium]|nr:restriction endonuclease subunit S [bacterium]